MTKICIVWMALLAVSVGLAAQGSRKSDAGGVSGRWDLVITGPAAHGDMTATLELQQDDKRVNGTLTGHGNTHKLAGELVDGALALETTDTPADHAHSLNAKLKDDGTLAGYLSGPMGDMQWTGRRNVER